jgi:hypothetical protein
LVASIIIYIHPTIREPTEAASIGGSITARATLQIYLWRHASNHNVVQGADQAGWTPASARQWHWR